MSGIPTIGSVCEGIREAMGDAAMYADRDDVEEWVACIRELEDPERFERLSRAAMARVAEQGFDDEFEQFARMLRKIAAGD